MNQEKRNFEFGSFRIDTVERLLFRGQETIPLTPKVADTLLALLSNAGRIVEKDDLMNAIWPDSFVDEGGLARNISALRKALGDGAGEPQYIETIPKRGYRFVGTLQPEPGETVVAPFPVGRNKARWLPMAVAALAALALLGAWWAYRRARPESQRFRSLLVKPFTNLSNDSTQEYVADGMTEGLINALTRIEALRVVSYTTAMTYKGPGKTLPRIARELNVDAVVEGSVAHSAGRVEIKVQLFDARADKPLWSGRYPGDLGNVLALQNEAAASIADEIQVTLTPVEKERLLAGSRQVDPAAWLDYSHGRFFWNKRTAQGIEGAIDFFGRAIGKDANYALAYSGLADAYALLGSTGADAAPPKEVMRKAKEAAQKAVNLDPALAEGHTSLGYVMLSYDWDLEAARREFARAIALNPGYATAHHWFAHYWLAMDQRDKALAESQKAQMLDPSSPVINVGVGWCYYHGRRFDEAIREYRAAIEISPDFGLAHAVLGMALEHSGAYVQAIGEFNKASQLEASPSFVLAGLGCAHALAGRAREARQALDQLDEAARQQYVPAVYRAAIWAALGDRDRGIEWTRKAVEERSDYMIYLGTEPWADPLRADPRFQQILQEVQEQHAKAP